MNEALASAQAALAQIRQAEAVENAVPPVQTAREYLAQTIPIPPRLVAPALFVRGGIHLCSAASGKGKTTLALNCMASWAAGRALFPGVEAFTPVGPLKSLLIENEGSAGEFHHKLGILLNKGPLSDEERELAKDNLLIWGDGGFAGFQLDSTASVELLNKACAEHKPDILFLDPLYSLWDGEENSASDQRKVTRTMQTIAKEHDLCIYLVHHDRKSGAGEDGDWMHATRGSNAINGVVTSQASHREVKGGDVREWEVTKSRHAQKPPPIRMTYNAATGWYSHMAEAAGAEAVLTYLTNLDGEATSVYEIAAALEEKVEHVRRVCNKLADEDPPRLKREPVTTEAGGKATGFRIPSSGAEAIVGLGGAAF